MPPALRLPPALRAARGSWPSCPRPLWSSYRPTGLDDDLDGVSDGPGQPKVRAAPDVLVALGRPKGYRGSYKTWTEEGVVPQVLFEVLSPGNTITEMADKHRFYQRHGVVEYYVIDPDEPSAHGYVRQGDLLPPVDTLHGFRSLLLGIRFELGDEVIVRDPSGAEFGSFDEVKRALDEAELRAREAEARVRAFVAEFEALKGPSDKD